MGEFGVFFWVVIAVALLSMAARRIGIPYPIVMVIGGGALALFPKAPTITLDPNLIFILFLPILLYSGGWTTDWRDFKFNLRPILLLAIGCVSFTTAVVAVVAHAIVPTFTWPAAVVFGAIVAPTDEVASIAIMGALSVPRRLIAIIEGESLVNDASALVIYRFAIVAAITGTFAIGHALMTFVLVAIGGIAIGLAVGYCYIRLQKFFNALGLVDPEVAVLISILVPFAAYLPADAIGVSGVLATVAAGIYVSRKSPYIFDSQTRLLAVSFWEMIIFLLNAMAFVLVGLQLRTVFAQLHQPLSTVLWIGIVMSAVVIIVRMIWIYPATYIPRLIFPQITLREGWPALSWPTLLGWTGLRGVVSLAAALAIPVNAGGVPFPGRDLIIFLTFCVIFATLVLQGLSLPFVIRKLGLREPENVGDREEAQARIQVAEAALGRLQELSAHDGATDLRRTRTEQLIAHYDDRIRHFRSHLQGAVQEQAAELEHEVDHALKREVLTIERTTLIQMRAGGLINDEIYRRIETDIDLAEAQLR